MFTHYLQEADELADRIAVINQGEIIAQGTPAEIKAKTAGKRIRCLTTLGLATLRQIPGVTEVKVDREAVEIHVVEAEPVVRELLSRDASLSGLEVTSAGLEDAFLALTQEAAHQEIRSKMKMRAVNRNHVRKHRGDKNEHSNSGTVEQSTHRTHAKSQTATIYLKEMKYEFLKNLRLRMYTASVLSFPHHVLHLVRACPECLIRPSTTPPAWLRI